MTVPGVLGLALAALLDWAGQAGAAKFRPTHRLRPPQAPTHLDFNRRHTCPCEALPGAELPTLLILANPGQCCALRCKRELGACVAELRSRGIRVVALVGGPGGSSPIGS